MTFSVLIWSALGRLNQMQQVGNSNVQTEATWFMKIGEHVMPVKCLFYTKLNRVISRLVSLKVRAISAKIIY